ncbi:MAG: rod-capping linker protein [Symploca sp. SIO2E6]|nr:rod-capping linker protein [Symploca sp. SIO2E6]
MSQMATVGTPQVSNYSGRIVEIEVTGVCRQDVKRVSAYKIKVPQSRMNQKMREIYRLGGQVTAVKPLG